MAGKKYPPVPPRIRATSKKDYEVVFIDEFADGKTLGECRWEPPQIVLKTGQSPKETFSTFVHEVIHMFAHEAGITLTETQVLKAEAYFLKLARLNKWI